MSEGFAGLASLVQAEMASQGVAPNAHLSAIGGTPAPVAAPAPAPAPVAVPPAPVSTPAPAVAPTGAELQQPAAPPAEFQVPTPIPWNFPDDALVDLGNGQIVPARELKGGGYRLADYTRKTQETAALRKEAEQVLQQAQQAQQLLEERQRVGQFLESPEHVMRYALESWGPQAVIQQLQASGLSLGQAQQAVAEAVAAPAVPGPQAPGQGPVATVADLQQSVAYLQHQLRQQQATYQQEAAAQTQQQVQQAVQALEDAKALSAYEQAVDGHIAQLLASDPFLQATPYAADVFKFKVMQAAPQSYEELQAILQTEAQAQVAKYRQAAEHHLKRSALAAAPPVPAIEPPGGAAPTPSAPNFFDASGKADWKALNNSVTAFLQQSARA